MVRVVNPIQFKLIRDFVMYLERGNSQSGYMITNKGNFSSSCFNHNVVPKPGENTILNIKFCLERISDKDLNYEIERFLVNKEEVI